MEKKHILIVDDDKSILETFQEILQSKGYNIDTSETGREAIEKSKTRFYNLALLDISLPDMEGTNLLTKLHSTTPKMMKIMVTGYPSQENAIRAVNQGADAYVVKPVNPQELIKIVEEKLKEQEKAEKMSEEKVADWIKMRIQKLKQEPKKNKPQ